MSELSAATIKKLKVGELKEELSKRNQSILGKKDELASRLLKLIDHGLLKPKSDEDRYAAMAEMSDPTEGEPNDATYGAENAKEACSDDNARKFDDSFFEFLDGVPTPPRRPLISAANALEKTSQRSVQSPPADIYISFERLAKSIVELQSLLQVERDRNFALVEENFSLTLKLGQKISTDCKVNNPEKTKEPASIESKQNTPLKSAIVYESIEIVGNDNKAAKKTKRKRKQKKRSKEISINAVNQTMDKKASQTKASQAPESVPASETTIQEIPTDTRTAHAATESITTNCEATGETPNEKSNEATPLTSRTPPSSRTSSPNKQSKSHTTAILGDSSLKNIARWKLKQRCEENENIYVHAFTGSTIKDMRNYCQPSLDQRPSQVIIHVGTNDLSDRKKSELQISQDMISLANEIRSSGTKVTISGLIAHFDYLEPKRARVNYLLKDMCQEEGITLIDNSNINPAKHLNSSKLRLNRAGDDIFADNLFRASRN